MLHTFFEMVGLAFCIGYAWWMIAPHTPHGESIVYALVKKFMQLGSQDTPLFPTWPDDATRILRARLIFEEAVETITALGVCIVYETESCRVIVGDRTGDTYTHGGSTFEDSYDIHIGGEGFVGSFRAVHVLALDDMVKRFEDVVDGCADIQVVTLGTLVAFGVPDEKVMKEVMRANLAKFGPGSWKDEGGKVRKPPGWTPPKYPIVREFRERLEAGETQEILIHNVTPENQDGF